LFTSLGRLEYQKDISSVLSDFYSRQGDFEKAYKYSQESRFFSDSIFNTETIKNIASIEQEYQNIRLTEVHKLRDQRIRAFFFASAVSLILLLIIIFLLYSRQKIRLKHQQLRLQNIELEKKQVEQDLDLRQKEIAVSTIDQVRKNETINDVIDRLKSSLKNLKEENKPVITRIIDELMNNAKPDIWKEFEIRFLQVHQEFYDHLLKSCPGLSTNEKRLCAFLRLDFSTKEISTITNQSPHSINIARTRLRKKLGLVNTDITLASFLSQF
jgi:DNA-binding CsgD family transcriptional regulator